MNSRPTVKAKKENKTYLHAAVFIERFFSEPPSRVKSITNIPSLLSIYLVLYQVKARKQDVLEFRCMKILGYKTHPESETIQR